VSEILASIAVIFTSCLFSMGQKWVNLNLRHKKSPSTNRKDLIHIFFGGVSNSLENLPILVEKSVQVFPVIIDILLIL